MRNIDLLGSLWRSASPAPGGGASTVGSTLGVTYVDAGLGAPVAPSSGSFLSEQRRTHWDSSYPAPNRPVAGVVSREAVTTRGPATTGFCVAIRFAATQDAESSCAFVGLCGASAAILASTSTPSATPSTIGVGFDAADAVNGSWSLIVHDDAAPGTGWKIPLGAAASRTDSRDAYLLFIAAQPQVDQVLVVFYNLTQQKLVTSEVVPTRLPAATTPLYVHAQVAQNAAGGADTVAFDLLGIDVYSSVDGRFDPRDFGAVGDGATDDQPAFQAALWTASRFVGAGGTAAGGVCVVVPPGNYLMASPLTLCGSVRFEGTCGSGPECPCILTFAPDIGAPDEGDDTVVEGCLVANHRGQAPIPVWKPGAIYVVGDLVQPNANWNGYYYRCVASANPHQSGAVEPNDWQTSFGSDNAAADGDVTWTCWGYLPSAAGAIVKNLVLTQQAGDYSIPSTGVRLYATARLEDVFVNGFQGDGVHVFGSSAAGRTYANCIGWTFAGTVRVWECGRYGVRVHGSDANTGTSEGLLDLTNNASFGLWSGGFFGSAYVHVHSDGNGVLWDADDAWWQHGYVAPFNYKWTDLPDPLLQDVAKGTLCLPSTNARRSGYQYRCVVAGRRGVVEPNWAAHVTIGGTFADGTCTWQCWMEEGGPIHTEAGAGAVNVFTRLHAELNQNPSDLRGADILLGANVESTLTQESAPSFARSGGWFMPMTFFTRTQEATPQRFLQIDVGSLTKPEIATTLSLSSVPSDMRPDTHDISRSRPTEVALYGYRWVEKVGQGSGTGVSYTQCQSIQLPESGAMCFPRVFVGSQFRHERRLTGAFAVDAAGTKPDTTNMPAAFGFYRVGDLVLNLWADNDTWADNEDMKWPVAWRPAGFGGVTVDVWQAGYPYRVGDVVLANGMSYRAETAGESGAGAPNWAALAPNLGDVFPVGSFDGAVQWRNVGAETDDLAWVPLIIESPLLFEKDVTNDDPGVAYVQMSEEQSAHARIRFTGAPNAARAVKVAPGCANGWVRHFRNDCGQDVTVGMVGAGGGAATVNMLTGTCASIFSDGTNCYLT